MSFELFKGAPQQSEWRRLTGREHNVVPGWWRVEASHGLALSSVFGLSLWAIFLFEKQTGMCSPTCILCLTSESDLEPRDEGFVL